MTNEMIEEYSSYIYGIAKKFSNYNNKEDLYQAGYMGLIKAYNNYDNKFDTKFTTYAYTYILGEMCKLVREDKNIRISKDKLKLKNQISKVSNLLSQKYQREPTNLEIASFLEITEKDVIEIKNINDTISIDKPISNNGKELNLYDNLKSDVLDFETILSLKEGINNLNEEEKKILFYSMNMNQTEIGNILNMNQVKVSRNLSKIKNKIKNKIV